MTEEKQRVVARRVGVVPGCRMLSSHQVKMIDEAISSIGEFGEVRLVVDRGRLRFVITQKSYDALKYRPGEITTD